MVLAGAMALATALGGAALLGRRAGALLLTRVQQQVHVIAYLDDGLGAAERDRLVEALRRLPSVEQAHLVGPDEALARLRTAAASLGGGAAISAVEPGFLPRSVEIAVRPSDRLAASTAELAGRLRKLPGIAEVDDMSEGLGRLESWLTLARRLGVLGLVLACVAAGAGVTLALLGWRGRGREAEVLRLLGETPAAISLAPALAAAATALVGALVGLVSTAVSFPRLVGSLATTARLGPLAVPALRPGELALALVIAAVLGAVAGHLGTVGRRGRG
jgi:cell division transport system permease protein